MSNTILVLPIFYKHSAARIDIDFKIISSDSDTVASVGTVEISPVGLTEDGVTISGATAKVWLTGGTDEQDYVVRVPITTTAGRLEQPQVTVKVRD